jgi:hypothetical protein
MAKKKPNARLYKHRIQNDGYDRHGQYWGLGMPLWRCETDDDTFYVRAHTRPDAKEKFVRLYSFLVFNNR